MPSARRVVTVPQADEPDGRARILDAALFVFAEDGPSGSLRTIAARANVSAALIIHHFGTKQALSAAVADSVSERILEAFRPDPSEPGDVAALHRREKLRDLLVEHPEISGYLRQLLATDNPEARRLFHALVHEGHVLYEKLSRGTLRPSADSQMQILVLVGYMLAPLFLAPYFDAEMGVPLLSDAGFDRYMATELEILTLGVYPRTGRSKRRPSS
jgi:AcrR family transcriptional regulator